MLEDLEEDWGITKSEEQTKKIEDLEVSAIREHCGGPRGEELPLIYLKGVFTLGKKLMDTRHPI